MAPVFDFIVVGSGPAGSAVASGLARARANPTVLLLEAGDNLEDRNLRVDGQRWLTFQNKNMNRGYKTVPQEYCNNRELDYSRGRGVGGSSAINFGVYSLGARDDYDEWAKIVGDDAFNWDHIHARFKELETFHGEVPAGVDKKYAAPKAADHGTTGPLHVGYAAEWEKDLVPTLDIFEQAGFPLNPDHNSGNPIGMSVLINSAHKGLRSTAKDLLKRQAQNLTIIANSPVQRLLLEDKKAVGVVANGTRYLASKEVILSAGALDTPKILMHSGIGPKGQLEKFDIPVMLDAPAVGQGLRDHYFIPLINTVASTNNDRRAFYGNKKVMDEALEQWKRDATGPWSKFSCECGIGWFKIDGLTQTKEFEDLPSEEQEYLQKETVPHYEIFTHFPIHWFVPDFPDSALDYTCLLVFLYNAQARGEVTLQSSDPNEPLRMDPKFLSHPFDRRAAIYSLRDAFRIAKHPTYIKDRLAELAAPKSNSDEDLLEYWKQNISSSWHMICTAKMGKAGDVDAVVDCDYRVMGIDGLRVADMSVIPVLVSGHIQAAAYVTGDTCAEKLIKEYNLA
ncbi:glucose-methanol-choline oxidoreductase [Histoplasma capsulatum G186AR]|uniref:Glucose-methanol-choline oxidoreductase n=1 Tax=Ajellomyces capsulatus TaxID=5037 RepID=A0A8H7YAF7_AJECA|nr:glucose-methanol-choline oxidoreductase [Histoplasma capsulatum]QSS70419.1 glucose-methanol-choline oxidoreductase [Histoplasma capsulatum G186AR]